MKDNECLKEDYHFNNQMIKLNNKANWNKQVCEVTHSLAAEPEQKLAEKTQIINPFVTESAARFDHNSPAPEKALLALTAESAGWVALSALCNNFFK